MILISWDWKSQPDWDEINDALQDQECPRIFVVDSGTDQFAIVIGDRRVNTEAQAQAHFDAL